MNSTNSKTDTVQTLGDTTSVGRLVVQLRQAIESGEFRVGDKIASLRSLADKCDVTFDAARSAVTRLETMGYLQRRRGSGTYVANWQETGQASQVQPPATVQTRNKSVALLLDNKVHHYGRFYDHLVDCLQLGGFGTSVFTWRHGWGEKEIQPVLEQLEQNPPGAIVIQYFNNGRADERINKLAVKHGIRVISSLTTRVKRPANWHCVEPDVELAASIAVQRLLDQGHKQIGVVVHSRKIDPSLPSQSRKRWTGHSSMIIGAGTRMREHGHGQGMHVYYHQMIDDIIGSSPTHPVNRELMRQWLTSPDCPTAFIGEDVRMAALLRVAEENNIQLPDNFQVVGIGNTPWASLMGFPSVWLREDLVAEHVFNLIQMEDRLFEGVAHRIVLQPQMVERP
ncbi:MAG TPA: hypothetical protein DCM28_15780 [Phycisphaerales bacterium]|nr:hypothetical protein [Phycisphaerales bacterium]HCD33804.1 hypothetical protein [Phycisphaerales bacterium]|tara:strand:+ start:825 stop:2012 length:1188 start_codon:yes stop_codon:yes gene_type:complete